MDGQGYVSIMASGRNGTIYLGSTNALARLASEHRNGLLPGFSRWYWYHLLVRYEAHLTLEMARVRECRLKDWKRAWKIREIEGLNPDWADLYDGVTQQ